MTDKRSAPTTYDDAIRAGFQTFEELPEPVQVMIREQDAAKAAQFNAVINKCRPGFVAPCSVTDYPDGARKVCYCNGANQCELCVFQRRS